MSQVKKKVADTKQCESTHTIQRVDNKDFDNSLAGQTHQCDLEDGHDGMHTSVLIPASKPDKPHEKAIYW